MKAYKEPVLFVTDDPKSVISETFRVLRTNLQFSSIDKPLKKVLFTSSMPNEGKSTVISNLAVTIAQNNSKVLLIDADLRRPTLHKLFFLENYKGMSNLLAENLPLESVIISTNIKNLDIITSGPTPPNPTEVLSSTKMKNFIENVSTLYDMVLIDSPPVNSVADASILSAYVDGVILVVEAGVTDRDALMLAKRQLDKVNAKIFGVVLNKVKEKHSPHYYYYYYYYGQDDSKIKGKRRKKK